MYRHILLVIFVAVSGVTAGLSGEGHLLGCYVGVLSQAPGGTVVFDNMTLVECENLDQICVKYELLTNQYGVDITTQAGICLNKTLTKLDLCDLASNYHGLQYLNCTYQVCNSSWCNKFRESDDCPQDTEDDIKLLPNCSFRETLHEVQKCAKPLFDGFPYLKQNKCLNNLDQMASCMAGVGVKCFSGSCFTVFDILPTARKDYRAVGQYFTTTKTFDDLFTLIEKLLELPGSLTSIKDIIKYSICPIHGYSPPLPRVENLMFGNLSNPVCEEGFMQNLTSGSLDLWKNFNLATTKQQLCVSFNNFASHVKYMIGTRCDLNEFPGFINRLLTGPYIYLQPVIEKAFTIVRNNFANIQLPKCGESGPLINCSHYYASPHPCEQRKAWFCDYVKWRWEIVQPQIPAYLRWVAQNGIEFPQQTPSCLTVPHDLCYSPNYRNCIRDSATCLFCWCDEQEYEKPDFMHQYYRRDFKVYIEFLSNYQYVNKIVNQGCAFN